MSRSETADHFAALRPRLVRLAYAHLGDQHAAEDAVQDAWVRLQTGHEAGVRELPAWLTTVVTRRCLDVLRSSAHRRELPRPVVLPEPVVSDVTTLDEIVRRETVEFAVLALMCRLPPAERVAYVLHDLFGESFERVGAILDRTPAAARQAASRARRRLAVADDDPGADEQSGIVEAFALAVATGDVAALVAILDPAVEYVADGGGVVHTAGRPIEGADRVARMLVALAKGPARARAGRAVLVNARPGILLDGIDGHRSVMAIAIRGGRITHVAVQRDPAKLTRSGPPC